MNPKWVDALLARFAVIWPRAWADQAGGVDRELLRAEWSQGLAGLTGEQIKTGIEACRNGMVWPPSIAEFRSACRGGATAEQLAFAARAAEDATALPQGTRAEALAKGVAESVRLKRDTRRGTPTRSLRNIERGLWTLEMEADYARHAAVIGLKLVPVEWPDDGP